MKDMIFWGVITICNLILMHNVVDYSLRIINFIACIVSAIFFVYSYSKEDDNENK